jgi:hypothetical protein
MIEPDRQPVYRAFPACAQRCARCTVRCATATLVRDQILGEMAALAAQLASAEKELAQISPAPRSTRH